MTMTIEDWAIVLIGAVNLCVLGWLFLKHYRAERRFHRELTELTTSNPCAALVEQLEQLIAFALALQLLRPPRPYGGAELVPWRTYPVCPDCGSIFLDEGPRGGAAVNLYCRDCGSRRNAIPPMGLIQRI